MKVKFLFALLLSILLLITCKTPETIQLTWYKGNLHTHTYWSDGDEFPEMVLDWYKSKGYDFAALSDHNTVARDEKWVVIQKSPLYETSFQNYLNKFGAEWVQFKSDTGRTQVKLKTFAEYKSKIEGDGFLIIPSEEISNYVDKIPVHVNATNIRKLIPAPNGATVGEAMQQSVDAVLKQREETGVPMIPHINHPNFRWAISLEDMINLKGERFFEVYNGHHLVNNYGDSIHMSTEAMWDKINIAYVNRNQPLMFGLATDDSHNYHQFGNAFANAGRGWVMVQAEKLDAVSLIAAMEAGNFYAASGVSLEEVSFENNELKIKVAAAEGVNYKIEFIGVGKNENESRVLKSIDSVNGSFTVTDEYLFVRALITSSKLQTNPFQDGDFEKAWTQPVFSEVGSKQ
ncbi:MAG: histidinol-phosphatase [Bacteroidota bacterium]|mgnify:CR=1 FL=1